MTKHDGIRYCVICNAKMQRGQHYSRNGWSKIKYCSMEHARIGRQKLWDAKRKQPEVKPDPFFTRIEK